MLISKKQFLANQANAKKSTGPKTQPGKDAAKLNALKHALYTKETVVYSAGETDAMWDSHLQTLLDSLRPQDAVQYLIVQDIASCTFRLQRLKRMESGHTDARANATYNATITRDKDGRPINTKYDGRPTGVEQANSRLIGDTAAQITTCTKLMPEIWRQEVRLRTAWQKNLKLLKELQSEQCAEDTPAENEPQIEENKPTPITQAQIPSQQPQPTAEPKPAQPAKPGENEPKLAS